MGAFDTYFGVVRCPRCMAPHWIDGQTKFFDPDYYTAVYFRVGEPCKVAIEHGKLADSIWDNDWLRIRDQVRADQLDLLVDFDELLRCPCGLELAIVLRFTLAAQTATLTEIQLLDARSPDLASHLDFISAEQASAELARAPLADRVAYLASRIAARFDLDDEPWKIAPWTEVVGPTRCEACGDVRERTDFTQLSRPDQASFFGPTWTGGPLYLGARLPFDDGWLADDVDRGHLFRARHPVGRDRLLILDQGNRYGCPCGAGPVTFVLHFTRHPGALELSELTLRVIASPDDLAGLDFIAGRIREGGLSREDVLHAVLADHINRAQS